MATLIARARARLRTHFADWLRPADVVIDGRRPWDIRVNDDRLFGAVRRRGLLGLGDAYVDGWWDCDQLDVFFDRCLRAHIPERIWSNRPVLSRFVLDHLFNWQSRSLAARHVHAHYDLGNDLFERMLDRRMTYSCGYWRHAKTLDEAQEAKLDLVCRKLGLARGMRVLDIGCGWGSFTNFAAEWYGCDVVGITLSNEQAKLARARAAGLPVEIRVQDYRAMSECFDRIVSIGMFEHVGPKNHWTYMRQVERCLAPGGLCLLHFFATRRTWPNVLDSEALWITKHIFPGVVVPSLRNVGAAIDGLFVVEDLENFGADYDPTLIAWFHNFDRAWPELRSTYGDRFYRMWKYYLHLCAGAFRSRKYSVWQFVLSTEGVPGGYHRPAFDRAVSAMDMASVDAPESATPIR